MYKVIVADDEEWVRRGIKAVLAETGYEFEILEASDGYETVSLISKVCPDIVLLDIKMPSLEGIGVLEEIRRLGVCTKVLILSGYSEFDYAHNALNLGACGYLLKPVGVERLKAKLQDIISEIEKIKQTGVILNEKNTLEKSNNLYMLEKTLNMLLHTPSKAVNTDIQSYSTYLGEQKGSIVLLHINNFSYNTWSDDQNVLYRLKKQFKELLNTVSLKFNAAVFDNYKNILELFVLIRANNERSLTERVNNCIAAIRKEAQEKLEMYMSIAVCKVADIPDSRTYQVLRDGLDMRFTKGNTWIRKCDDLASCKKIGMTEEEIRLFEQLLLKLDYERIKSFLNNLLQPKTGDKEELRDVRIVFSEIMSILVRICNQMKMDISEILSDSDLSGEVLDYFDNITEVSSYLYTTIVTALKIELHDAQKCSNIVEMIIHYVDNNYEKNFTVKDIAYQFAINPNYFSMLFKKAKGQGFIEYVNSRKIEAACKLLLSTSTKSVTEIAESLGFGDVQYFFKLFKRVKGQTPLEYKRAQIK